VQAVPLRSIGSHFDERKAYPEKSVSPTETIPKHARVRSAIRYVTEIVSITAVAWILDENGIRLFGPPVMRQIEEVPDVTALPPCSDGRDALTRRGLTLGDLRDRKIGHYFVNVCALSNWLRSRSQGSRKPAPRDHGFHTLFLGVQRSWASD